MGVFRYHQIVQKTKRFYMVFERKKYFGSSPNYYVFIETEYYVIAVYHFVQLAFEVATTSLVIRQEINNKIFIFYQMKFSSL